MHAMQLERAHAPLRLSDVEVPHPGRQEVLLRVLACGVCRTDLHILDGELAQPRLPLIPGHEVVGVVVALGQDVERLRAGDRVGVPWLGWTCGECDFCLRGRENLCERARFTGYHIDGGYAQYAVANERYCFAIPERFADVEAAPLLCAGLIGYRALRLAGEAARIGLYGFGAAAHIAVQVARHRGQEVFAFTRPGDHAGQAFARSLGANWAGGSDETPPEPLDAALLFAPVGALVPAALAATARGGTVVCAGIHMSDIPQFPYRLLWEERVVRSVANLTRDDGLEFLAVAGRVPVVTTTERFALAEANEALTRLRAGNIEGAAVLVPAHDVRA
jgi:propanol-preferring alcohol dehydrogenase